MRSYKRVYYADDSYHFRSILLYKSLKEIVYSLSYVGTVNISNKLRHVLIFCSGHGVHRYIKQRNTCVDTCCVEQQ